LNLQSFHNLGVCGHLVIVTQQVQHTVNDHMGPVGLLGFVLLLRFASYHWRADDEISQQP
jgi:hypothetical protein